MRNHSIFWAAALVAALVAALPAAVRAGTLVFVSAATEKQIVSFSLNEQSGALTELARISLDGEPGALAVLPRQKLLLAAMRSTGTLKSLRIDPDSGKLALLSTVEAGADPAQISVDESGKYLFTAYYVAAKISVHEIDSEGRLGAKPRQEIATAEKAHAVVLDPRGEFAFVPHTGPNAVFQFRWNAAAGRLAASEPPRLDTGEKTGPRHMVWRPRQDVAYIDNEQGSSVTAYRLDRAKGTLAPLATVSTLPEGYAGANSCAEIRLHPSGRFLYVSNRGHDSLAMFAVTEDGTRLESLGQQPTERTPRSFGVSPSGAFLIAAGEGNGRLAVFEIDRQTGTLAPRHVYPVGPRLWWVLAASFE